MKQKLNKILLASVLLCCSALSYGQQNNLRSAYFLDGYTYNYKLNPAMAPERGFFAIPALGNVGLGVESNLALSTFLYPTDDGQLTTFLDDRVSAETFAKNIRKRNNINANANLSVIALGFRTGKSYHTFDVSAKSNICANIPGGLFTFVKEGTENGAVNWDISNLGVRANLYSEVAYGYSRSIGENMRVGGRLKFLMGYAMADIKMEKFSLTVSENQWAVSSYGEAVVAGPVEVSTVPGSNNIDFGSMEFASEPEDALAPFTTQKSIGLGLDLGFSIDFLEHFTASVSILDLGGISWNNAVKAVTPDGSWTYNGLGDIEIDEDSSFGDQFSQMGDELMGMVQLNKAGEGSKAFKGLGATVHAGIEARMPFYDRLSFGLLASHRFHGAYSWSEARLSMNLALLKFFSLAGSCAYSNYGGSLGGVVNIHLPGLNLYAGVDSYSPLLNVTPQYVPIGNLNTNLVLGLNLSFGKAVGRYRVPKVK